MSAALSSLVSIFTTGPNSPLQTEAVGRSPSTMQNIVSNFANGLCSHIQGNPALNQILSKLEEYFGKINTDPNSNETFPLSTFDSLTLERQEQDLIRTINTKDDNRLINIVKTYRMISSRATGLVEKIGFIKTQPNSPLFLSALYLLDQGQEDAAKTLLRDKTILEVPEHWKSGLISSTFSKITALYTQQEHPCGFGLQPSEVQKSVDHVKQTVRDAFLGTNTLEIVHQLKGFVLTEMNEDIPDWKELFKTITHNCPELFTPFSDFNSLNLEGKKTAIQNVIAFLEEKQKNPLSSFLPILAPIQYDPSRQNAIERLIADQQALENPRTDVTDEALKTALNNLMESCQKQTLYQFKLWWNRGKEMGFISRGIHRIVAFFLSRILKLSLHLVSEKTLKVLLETERSAGAENFTEMNTDLWEIIERFALTETAITKKIQEKNLFYENVTIKDRKATLRNHPDFNTGEKGEKIEAEFENRLVDLFLQKLSLSQQYYKKIHALDPDKHFYYAKKIGYFCLAILSKLFVPEFVINKPFSFFAKKTIHSIGLSNVLFGQQENGQMRPRIEKILHEIALEQLRLIHFSIVTNNPDDPSATVQIADQSHHVIESTKNALDAVIALIETKFHLPEETSSSAFSFIKHVIKDKATHVLSKIVLASIRSCSQNRSMRRQYHKILTDLATTLDPATPTTDLPTRQEINALKTDILIYQHAILQQIYTNIIDEIFEDGMLAKSIQAQESATKILENFNNRFSDLFILSDAINKTEIKTKISNFILERTNQIDLLREIELSLTEDRAKMVFNKENPHPIERVLRNALTRLVPLFIDPYLKTIVEIACDSSNIRPLARAFMHQTLKKTSPR